MEQTVKCPICGEPYVFYPFFAGDQSACPSCVARAREPKGYRIITSTEGTLTKGVGK